jgi:Family of unknown function (DUF5908)
MPIVINELVFKATVAEPAARGTQPPAAPEGKSFDGEALVAACVEQVLRVLERQKER